MGGIFVIYRRSAPDELVIGIYERLRDYFGDEQVFLDRKSIALGRTYWEVIHKRLRNADVLLVLVHGDWHAERDEDGVLLLDRERDWVREEIELGLSTGKTIIPVLLDDADWPADADLPASILPIRGHQSHRVRNASAAADVDELIAWLKAKVAPSWTPGDGGNTGQWRAGRWFAYLTGLVSLVALAGPSVLVRDDAAAAPGELPPLVPTAAAGTAAMLAVPAVFWFVQVPFGKVISSWEWEAHRAPANRYNVMILPAAGMFLAILVWLTVSTDMSYAGRASVFVSLFASAIWGAVIAMRNERKDRDLDDRWPHTLGRPLRAPAVRRAMVRLDRRLTTWNRRLSREQEDKARWMLNELANATLTLNAEAARGRSRWLVNASRWALFG